MKILISRNVGNIEIMSCGNKHTHVTRTALKVNM